MANQKISQLTEQTDLSLIDGLAGYEGTSNVRISGPNIISAIPTIYSADSDLLELRTVNDRTGGFTGTAGSNAIKFNFRNSGSIVVAGYQNNGDPGTTNNLLRWGPGLTNGTMNVRGNLTLSSGGGAINLVNSSGAQYLTMAQQGTTINTNVGFGLTTGVSARLHVKGSGSTNATTAFLVEDNLGNDIIKALDDRTIGLGYNGVQITNSVSGTESVRINDRSGAPLMKVGVTSGSAAKINICNGYFNIFDYSAVGGMVFTNGAGFNVSQDAASMFTLISTTKGMLPPRMTTTQRDAINSGTFTTGLTLYNTTDNKLQYYNGTSWVSASGGGGGLTPTTQTANYTASANDFVICNVTTSLRVTLPAASAGAIVGIKYASQNAASDVCDILTPSVGVTIDGTDRSSTALPLPSINTYYELISDGTNWFIK